MIEWRDVTGVILAAGRGTRMQELGSEYPKPLLPICNEPLLVLHVKAMRDLGIRRVIVVVGHLGAQVRRHFEQQPVAKIEVEFVEQGQQLGIAHAVGRLEASVDGPMLLFLGDIFFVTTELNRMREQFTEPDSGAVLAVRHEPDVEAIKKNFTVEVDAAGRVNQVIEKPRLVRTGLKGCGLYLLSAAIFDAIRRTPRTAARDEYEITTSIQLMIDSGGEVRVAPVIERDINLTYPADLLECNLLAMELQGKQQVIGQRVYIDPGTQLRRCVVGDDARIEAACDIGDSVLLPGARLDAPMHMHRAVVTPTNIIRC